jgi:4-amino-4-deoxy-L-arabinose transferase-like glycosyltransferase
MNACKHRWLLTVFFVALALRLAYVLWTGAETLSTNGYAWADEGTTIAMNMLAGKGYVTSYSVCRDFRSFRMPVLPLLLFTLWSTFGPSILLAKLVMALLSATTCVLTVALARRLFDGTVGIAAGLILACYPGAIHWSATLGPVGLASLFLVSGIIALVSARTAAGYGLAGLAFGMLALTRPIYLPYAVLLTGLLAAHHPKARWRATALPFALAVVTVLAPWVARNWWIHRAFVVTSTEGGLTFVECNSPYSLTRNMGEWTFGFAESQPAITTMADKLPEVAFDRWLYRKGLTYIGEHPLAYARAFLLRIWYLWRPAPRLFAGGYSWKHSVIMTLTWSPLFLLAAYAAWSQRLWRRSNHAALWLAVLWITLAAGLIRGSIRYRGPLEPLVICYAAAGLHQTARRFLCRSTLDASPDPR